MVHTLLNDQDLKEVYIKAVQLDLDPDFIRLIKEELEKRGMDTKSIQTKKWFPNKE